MEVVCLGLASWWSGPEEAEMHLVAAGAAAAAVAVAGIGAAAEMTTHVSHVAERATGHVIVRTQAAAGDGAGLRPRGVAVAVVMAAVVAAAAVVVAVATTEDVRHRARAPRRGLALPRATVAEVLLQGEIEIGRWSFPL